MSARRPRAASRTSWASWAGLIALVLALPALDGCGKKPGHIDPAADAGPAAASFPRGYPNPAYDHAPPPAKLAPLVPRQSYPGMIRPEDLGAANSTLTLPGQNTGGGRSDTSGTSDSDQNWPGMPRP